MARVWPEANSCRAYVQMRTHVKKNTACGIAHVRRGDHMYAYIVSYIKVTLFSFFTNVRILSAFNRNKLNCIKNLSAECRHAVVRLQLHYFNHNRDF